MSEIQTLTSSCHWRHVSSQDNPADLMSRGQLPSEFVEAFIWFDGPLWLAKDISLRPKGVLTPIVISKLKPITPNTFCMKIEIKEFNLLEKYSSFNKLQRIIAYILRFICNCKLSKTKRAFGPLQATELKRSHYLIIRIVQLSAFKTEIELIKNGEPLPHSSKLIPLNPILDEFGILRVGGRHACASIAEDQRHPILLPAQHFLTRIIILSEHLRLKHAGPQATLYSVRQVYWPINGRNITRNLISKCIPCFRAKPRLADHQMGILPKQRVTSSRPFLRVGVDYCGLFYIKEKRHRNRAQLVSDLTAEAFLASLKRLFSRRGKAVEIHSDNGTNFVGAKNELNELYELFNSKSHQAAIANFCNEERIEWYFIPPRSPHFGGIWEAAVKTFKHHLVRTVGDTLLTFEQLETCIIEIEAILNSRPISPMSSDPHDLLPLTPAHFLIGSPLTSFPQVDFTDTQVNRLSAWQHAQQLKQHFWKRWHKEYLHQLIKFSGTQRQSTSLKIGDLVLISDENLPPLKWAAGRIIAVHPGKDNVVRVVTLKTKTGQYDRCVKKLCLLPIDEGNDFT
ncbi:uncharacterized protein LOC123261416 [Cotesia glomerata]|uniref:uncharacterized protein LOC123261416 n=1 Tax=Cotesia glomerata TaxID=32391 RepID=UPI001D00807E|nr:uncharacterized protein LOC123261416 [Cotesia glomerata]